MKHTATKLITLLLALCMVLPFALIGCAKQEETPNNTDPAGIESGTNASAKVALDLTAEWETINGKNTLVQGCLVINTAFAAAHPNEVAKFLQDYSASVTTVKSGSEDAINMIVNAGILPKAAIAKKALPNCNLCYIAGSDMKPVMNTFCNKIFSYDATSIGGALPTDGFYYTVAGDATKADKNLEMKIYALNGTTALGMAQMIDNEKNNKSDMNYNISLHTAADAITGAIVSGECAIAALPTNVAVKLFNKSQGKLQLLALNTLGVLYLLQNGEGTIASLADLKGKTIYLPGAGSNPEYITAALVQSAGLKVGEDVTLDTTSYNSPDALQAAFVAGQAPLAVLPEPKVTVALTSANAAQ
ncbi:MAG: ABC transporter substrate-binding protein [Clostridia bacterium]|nr:ABC transporter substrate-binding protein [Clostridia bacterium]